MPDHVSNWGRWGDNDELGTLNLIDDEGTRAGRGAGAHRAERVAGQAHRTGLDAGRAVRPTHTAVPPVQQAMVHTGVPPMAMAEVLVVTPHNPGLTHLDATVHIPVDGHVYPGRPLTEAVTPIGVRHGSTTAFADGVLTRGVLLDLAPGDRLPPAHPSPAPTTTPPRSKVECAWSPGTRWWSAAAGRSPGTPPSPCPA